MNKRSQRVRQAGDLCFPGGGIHFLDKALSKLVHLPGLPMADYARRVMADGQSAPVPNRLKLLLATSLREAWEEMRLNPLRVKYLGALPPQRLVMFEQQIQPMVGWVRPGLRFRPNWEVARIVHIPLRKLLEPENYGRYLLTLTRNNHGGQGETREFPCFFHHGRTGTEMLWGASFRITMDFLRIVFDFSIPDLLDLPVVKGRLGEAYLDGSRPQRTRDDGGQVK